MEDVIYLHYDAYTGLLTEEFKSVISVTVVLIILKVALLWKCDGSTSGRTSA
jgi:hypothetical protein